MLYADDAVICYSATDPKDAISHLQDDLQLIFKWMQFNKLTINISKSKYMVVGSKYMLDRIDNNLRKLTISSQPLLRVQSYDYLGATLDCYLNMCDVLTKTYSRTAHKLYLSGLIRKIFAKKEAINVFKAMVLPYIDYPLYLFYTSSDKLLTKLQRLQNKGLRICLKAPARTPVRHMHKDCKQLYVKNRMHVGILNIMHRRVYCTHCDDLRFLLSILVVL